MSKIYDRDRSILFFRAGYRALSNIVRGKILDDGTDVKVLKVVKPGVFLDIFTTWQVPTKLLSCIFELCVPS